MKLNKYIYLLLGIASVTSCDIDRFPESSTVTEDQKSEIAEMVPERLSADVNGLKSGLTTFGTVSTSTSTIHMDFGFPAACISYDQSGMDMIAENHGYNWFSGALMHTDRLSTSTYNVFNWRIYYNHIKTANDLIATIKSVGEENWSEEMKNYYAMALTGRAFDYLNLVQSYQFTYIGNEEKPAVPIVLDDITEEQQTNNPRATVKAVYEQIMKDLDLALDMFAEAGIERANKAEANANVAYGLRARANLLMGNWAQAAQDANAAREGYEPLSMGSISVPSFTDINASSWIWGIIITPEDDVVQTSIINWPSHMCAITGNGYTTGIGVHYAHRRINSTLYDWIPETDVRKGWFAGADPVAEPSQGLINMYGAGLASALANAACFGPYNNTKFGTVSGDYFDTDNSQDWPIMRAEEMILIEAEALAHTNPGEAKNLLENFVKNYRNPEYVCTASSTESLVDEVWMQRRVELWGEGFSLFDLLRLKKPLVRKGAGFSGNCTWEDVQPGYNSLIYMIPDIEINSNNGISEDDNNEAVVPPTPLG